MGTGWAQRGHPAFWLQLSKLNASGKEEGSLPMMIAPHWAKHPAGSLQLLCTMHL